MPIRFDHPELLLLGLLALPLSWVGWRALRAAEGLRKATILLLRAAVVLLLAGLLASPRIEREHDDLTVIGVLDISGSVRRFASLPDAPEQAGRGAISQLRWWFREATRDKRPDDRFGMVVFDGRAAVVATPTRGSWPDEDIDLAMIEGTNIAEAIRLAMAMFPPNTGRRLVLATDGNETAGDALAAAREAAGMVTATGGRGGGIGTGAGSGGEALGAPSARAGAAPGVGSLRRTGVPIDVLPLAYRVESDTQIARVEAPSAGRPGQIVPLRVVIESLQPAIGWITLRREGAIVDLAPEEDEFRRRVEVPAGTSVHTIAVALGETPINRFEAFFEPDDAAADLLPENNRAEAFIASPGTGAALLVRGSAVGENDPFEAALRAASIPVEVVSPGRVPRDLLTMQAYDVIVLQNVGAWEIDPPVQEAMARSVNDFGTGLIMLGGENGFGAGGWNGTPVEAILPVELDLPRSLRLTEAALVIVLDKSGSMARPVAGARRSQQEIANEGTAWAIESLQPDSQVGVVVFDSFSQTRVPLGPNTNPRETAERVRGIAPGGGTHIGPALRRAQDMLRTADVRRKYIVLLTDGQSEMPEDLRALAAELSAEGISLSTIAVGDDADHGLLRDMATIGGGQFYPVLNPNTLPAVMVDSVRVVNRPLIKEATFQPVVVGPGAALTQGMDRAPALHGLVLTSFREDPRVTVEMVTAEEEPLLTHWQAGLGRVVAFTSDAHGEWSRDWVGWSEAESFWAQLSRLVTRSPLSREFEFDARIDDGQLTITLDATRASRMGMDQLVVTGTVYGPDGRSREIRLRQAAPGRYAATIDAPQSGYSVIALMPRRGQEVLAPIIGAASQATGVEYRRYRSNIDLLRRVADETGGRLLEAADPRGADLFDREGLPPSVSLLPVWRELLWLLLGLVLLDVTARRLAWDRDTIARAISAAVARVRHPRERTREVRTTLASLKERGREVEQTVEREGAAFSKLTGDSRLRTREEVLAQRAREQGTDAASQQARREAALDQLAGRRDGGTSDSAAQGSAQAAPMSGHARRQGEARSGGHAEPERGDDEAPGMMRDLLKIKKRLRGE